IYAQVEAPEARGGLYRSSDNGVTWQQRNSSDSQGQYYAKVVVDPVDEERVYVMNVNIMVSNDGGRTLASLPTRNKHVDNHDIWVDPKNN
ncbi:WD40/YVTN/BNR-like repeat-containing protein, partial [Salmonella enterica]|uniref:WD40/YVTN/BNR-like repeat-containing protein n=1 Tax=Salmonella enterica TaxID=28901 RepID=UPI003D28B5BC